MDQHAPATTAGHAPDHSGHFKSYMAVFAILCGLTLVSFVCNELERHGTITKMASLWTILGVAVIKAVCVAVIFMHLRQDWGRLYFIVIPVVIMGIMMSIVLLPDIVLAWHENEGSDGPPAASAH